MTNNIIINIFIDEAGKGNLHEVVLFLRVDAVETETDETDGTGGTLEHFSLHLDVSADIPLPKKPAVPPETIKIGGDFEGIWVNTGDV